MRENNSTIRPGRSPRAVLRRGSILVTAVAAAGALVAAAPQSYSAPEGPATATAASGHVEPFLAPAPRGENKSLKSPVDAIVRSEVLGATAKSIILPSTRVTARWAGSLQPWLRWQVNRAYWWQYRPNMDTPIGWSGDNDRCRPGAATLASRRATRESINFVRSLNGLAPVGFGPILNNHAQRSALLMSANTALSHNPDRSWRCYTWIGDRTAAKSNLALNLPDIQSGRIVDMYMDDAGSGNHAVGHRRWVLYPFTKRMGNGSTSSANALQVVGPTNRWNPNPRFTSWPTRGFFPAPMEPGGRWSLSSGLFNEDFSRAVVKVWHNGRRIYPTKLAVHSGYGMPTLAWDMPREASRLGRYVVTVTGITRPGLARSYSYSYVTSIFQPWRPAA